MTVTFTPRRLVQFAGAALDFYEIHHDRDVATEQGLDGILVHGALKNALLVGSPRRGYFATTAKRLVRRVFGV